MAVNQTCQLYQLLLQSGVRSSVGWDGKYSITAAAEAIINYYQQCGHIQYVQKVELYFRSLIVLVWCGAYCIGTVYTV